jgi:hypothetical protein
MSRHWRDLPGIGTSLLSPRANSGERIGGSRRRVENRDRGEDGRGNVEGMGKYSHIALAHVRVFEGLSWRWFGAREVPRGRHSNSNYVIITMYSQSQAHHVH